MKKVNLVTTSREEGFEAVQASDFGALFQSSRIEVLDSPFARIAKIILNAEVASRVKDLLPFADYKTGDTNFERDWEKSFVPDELLAPLEQVDAFLIKGIGANLELPTGIHPVVNSDEIEGVNYFHIDEETPANMVLHLPTNPDPKTLRSILTLATDSNYLGAPNSIAADEFVALGLHPQDALIFGKKFIHAPASAKKLGLTKSSPELFSSDSSAHLVDLVPASEEATFKAEYAQN